MSEPACRVVFVDDDELLRVANSQSLRLAGCTVETFPSARSAMPHIDADFDGVVISDIRMPEMDGLQFLRAIQAIDPDIPVVLITGHGDVPMAVSALKSGAHDFLTKPFLADHLIATVRRACSLRSLVIENRRLHQIAELGSRKSPLIGETPVMVRLRSSIEQIAGANVDVILEGETGTGKELVAMLLHKASRRRARSFVSFACDGASDEIVESELFGDAIASRPRPRTSQIEAAHRGTLFLDNADRLPLSAQSRLMQLLEDGVLRSSHAAASRPVEITVIASCRGELQQAVREGRFREDLYYRLDMARLSLPPLRARKADVPLLFVHFVKEALPKSAVTWPDITEDIRRHLFDHTWSGNARELKTFAVRFAHGLLGPTLPGVDAEKSQSLADRNRLYEEATIREVLTRCKGDVSTTIIQLQIPRKTFYDKLARHKIDINLFRRK